MSVAYGESGSFRDPASRVFVVDGDIRRALSREGVADFVALSDSGLLDDPRVIATERLDDAHSPVELPDGVAAVLRHERVPFVSYPYEWTFSMLRDAALLQLDLTLAALDSGLMLKDATPYNVQFVGTRPVFIDVGSFERLHAGELWVGYRQFCMQYLFPLLLQAHKKVAFQPWLRGSIEGVPASDYRGLTSLRDRFRRGYLTHVFLQARLDRHPGSVRERAALKTEVATSVIRANVKKMRRLVAGLRSEVPAGEWVRYGADNSYTPADAATKDEFVRSAVATNRWSLVWDLGCNNGRHARIAAAQAAHVLAVDADAGTVDLLYRELRAEGDTTILPLVVNLADPSPGLGWRGCERPPLLDRGRPDLVLALALVHHLAIASNVPLAEVVDWLASLGAALVVEFPTRDDPMVQSLLARKRRDLHPDYHRAVFERALAQRCDIQRQETLGSGTRVLYFATPKDMPR
ncbi:MAG: hypothetical protein QOK28_3690 [Actinomycetota bacterium]